MSPWHAVSFYLTRFTFSPPRRGSFVSVALSLESLPVAVSDCHALCCPDFPLRNLKSRGDHLMNYLNKYIRIKSCKGNKRAPRLDSTLDIPYRIGKVGARKTFPRKRIIKAPYLYDIQENHTRQVLPRDYSIITF